MALSVQNYSIAWSDHFIRRIDRLLRDVHGIVGALYDKNAYPRRVVLRALKSSEKYASPIVSKLSSLSDGKEDSASSSSDGYTLDAISPGGSFMLRTCVHRTPFEENHSTTGIGIDVVLTIPEQICSEEDLREGRYLTCREAFLKEVLQHLKSVQQRMQNQQEGKRKSADGENEEEEEEMEMRPKEALHREEGEEKENSSRKTEEDDGNRSHKKKYFSEYSFMKSLPKHFERMDISVLPIHECFGCEEKKIIRLRWRRKGCSEAHYSAGHTCHRKGSGHCCGEHYPNGVKSTPSSSDTTSLFETPYVDIHFRPAMHSARVSGLKVLHKHPLYSYLVLEDYWMPIFLEKLHRLCVNSPGLRRTIVLLKCWALHLGLHAPSSGHSEGLNGFLMAAMVLYLLEEEAILNCGMTEDTAARAVLVYISGGGFTKPLVDTTNATGAKLPAQEENGQVPHMRFSGDALNLLFRSSTTFFKFVVERAAQESLAYSKLSELFTHVPFQPLAFRHDLSLSVNHCPCPAGWKPDPPSHVTGNNVSTKQNVETREDTKTDSKGEEEEENQGQKEEKQRDLIVNNRIYFSPLVSWAHHIRHLIQTALQSRVVDVTVWPTGNGSLQLTVSLISTADGRRRLTTGPPVEDEEAVKAFNAFWGNEITSTRQFSDGAIYRCVLWDLPEYSSAEQMAQHIIRYALRRHVMLKDSASSLSSNAIFTKGLPSSLKNSVEENAESREVEVNVLLGGLEGFLSERVGGGEWKDVQPLVKKPLWDACKAVREMIAHLPDTALPCKILEFDFISASERCTEVFPVRPHLALTLSSHVQLPSGEMVDEKAGESIKAERKEGNGGADSFLPLTYFSSKPTIEPIHCVLTIDDRNRIPDNLEAVQLMKAAIGAQLSKSLQSIYGPGADSKKLKKEEETHPSKKGKVSDTAQEGFSASSSNPPIYASCHPHGVDIICHGFFFRVYVAHYREVSLLRALQMSSQADIMEQKLFWTVLHTKLIRSIVYGHPSYSSAVRLAKRWVSAMLLYEFILPEAIELLVAHAYLKSHEAAAHRSSTSTITRNNNNSPCGSDFSLTAPPRTALAGFMRFIELLATHNWEKPLVLPTTDDAALGDHGIEAGGGDANEKTKRQRTVASVNGAAQALWREQQKLTTNGSSTAMFIAAPYAPTSSPFTVSTPRKMVLHRLIALAKGAFFLLLQHLQKLKQEPQTKYDCKHHDGGTIEIPSSCKEHGECNNVTESLLFRSSLMAFDIALCFHPSALVHHDRMTTVACRGNDIPQGEVERIWQLDELEPEERVQYVARRVERDPAGQTVRIIRRALRDKAMAFYDALGPSSALFLVALQESQPSQRELSHLAKEAIEAASGALLPSPIIILKSGSTSSLQDGSSTPSFPSKNDEQREKRRVTREYTSHSPPNTTKDRFSPSNSQEVRDESLPTAKLKKKTVGDDSKNESTKGNIPRKKKSKVAPSECLSARNTSSAIGKRRREKETEKGEEPEKEKKRQKTR